MATHETYSSGYRALRRGRWSQPSQVYLVTTVVHQRQPLFTDWQFASIAASVLGNARAWRGAELLSWVLMPDHWHGLLQLQRTTTLADLMRQAKGSSAHQINRQLGRTGPVWMPGFHDRALRKEVDVLQAARYIIANPVRAGLVNRVGDYPYWDAVWLPGG